MSAHEVRKTSSLNEEAADWYARLRSNALSEVEEARFRAWLSGDPARRRAFDELSALWDELEGVAQSPEVLAERREIAKTISAGRVSRRALIGWAAAAAVAGVAGFVSWQRFFASESYVTGVGEQRTVLLRDQSTLMLNTSSRVRVRFSGKVRRIELLQGQAHFQVAKDAARPFIVRVARGEVAAIGTAFDVYQRASDVVVTLLEGRVSVVPDVPAGKGAIELNAGEQVSFGAAGRDPVRSHADLQRVAAWRARKLFFADTPLAEAIAEANRYSRLMIELRAPRFADARISGTFDAGDNEALAAGVQAYFGLRVERSDNDWILLTEQAR